MQEGRERSGNPPLSRVETGTCTPRGPKTLWETSPSLFNCARASNQRLHQFSVERAARPVDRIDLGANPPEEKDLSISKAE